MIDVPTIKSSWLVSRYKNKLKIVNKDTKMVVFCSIAILFRLRIILLFKSTTPKLPLYLCVVGLLKSTGRSITDNSPDNSLSQYFFCSLNKHYNKLPNLYRIILVTIHQK